MDNGWLLNTWYTRVLYVCIRRGLFSLERVRVHGPLQQFQMLLSNLRGKNRSRSYIIYSHTNFSKELSSEPIN